MLQSENKMEGEKYAMDLATQRSLATLVVYFHIVIEKVEKACVPKTSCRILFRKRAENKY